jgi:hypothetical protein
MTVLQEVYCVYRPGVDAHSGSHLLADFGAATARIHAFPHFTYPLTICGALFADPGALATGEFVKFRAEQHEMRGRPTNLGASHHHAEVLGLGMLTADLQTVSHSRRQASLITAQTFGDAALHLIVGQMHGIAPFKFAPRPNGPRYYDAIQLSIDGGHSRDQRQDRGVRPGEESPAISGVKDLYLRLFDRKTASRRPQRTCQFGHTFSAKKEPAKLIGRGIPSSQSSAPRPSPIAFLLQASCIAANACAGSRFLARRSFYA